jgi:hypothetical protein
MDERYPRGEGPVGNRHVFPESGESAILPSGWLGWRKSPPTATRVPSPFDARQKIPALSLLGKGATISLVQLVPRSSVTRISAGPECPPRPIHAQPGFPSSRLPLLAANAASPGFISSGVSDAGCQCKPPSSVRRTHSFPSIGSPKASPSLADQNFTPSKKEAGSPLR